MKKTYTLECCVDSVESALAAYQGGATRLELCSSLITGGLSPSLALFHEIRRQCGIRIHVLLRPRFGDFLYTGEELRVLREEARLFREAGAEGLVIGCLTPGGELDLPQMRALMEEAGGMSVTLHRAFDMCRDPFLALEQARSLGIGAILTSGQQNSCTAGKELLCRLAEAAGENGPDILVGGGVNAGVISDFLRDTPLRSFHMSGKRVLKSGMTYRNPKVSMGVASLDEYQLWRTDPAAVAAAVQVLEENLSVQ